MSAQVRAAGQPSVSAHGGAGPIPVTAVVLTLDEEENLPGCLESLSGWAREVFVVDSGSTDSTREIASGYGARVLQHSFETHARQWRWALGKLPPDTEWLLALDADQRVTPRLREELTELFSGAGPEGVAGFYVKRRQIFRGQWIRHGGYYPKYLLKLFRRSRVRVDEGDLMDHRFYVDGKTVKLRADIVEDNRKEYDISFWVEKHNQYAIRHAREEWLRRNDPSGWPIAARFFGAPDQRSAWLRGKWYALPLYIRPALYFFYRYVLRFGWLDGKQGFIFHFLQAFWYRLLIDIHLDDRSGTGGPPEDPVR